MKRVVLLAMTCVLLSALIATAQENRSEVSLQGAGWFTNSTGGNGTSYNATQSGGILGTYRYHLSHWISAEAAYGYSQSAQKYVLPSDSFRIQSGIQEFTGSLVVNLPTKAGSRFNPYFLAGGGGLRFGPTSSQSNSLSGAQAQTRGAFDYGAGLNYSIYRGLSLRAEYRGLVYTTPDFGFGGLATNSTTHTAIPSFGFSFRF